MQTPKRRIGYSVILNSILKKDDICRISSSARQLGRQSTKTLPQLLFPPHNIPHNRIIDYHGSLKVKKSGCWNNNG